MPTKYLKLVVLLLIGLALWACMSQDPLELPAPIAPPGGSDSGWKDY